MLLPCRNARRITSPPGRIGYAWRLFPRPGFSPLPKVWTPPGLRIRNVRGGEHLRAHVPRKSTGRSARWIRQAADREVCARFTREALTCSRSRAAPLIAFAMRIPAASIPTEAESGLGEPQPRARASNASCSMAARATATAPFTSATRSSPDTRPSFLRSAASEVEPRDYLERATFARYLGRLGTATNAASSPRVLTRRDRDLPCHLPAAV
jgi:hypothetical protein